MLDQMREGSGMTRGVRFVGGCAVVMMRDGLGLRVPVSELGASPATSQAEAAEELPVVYS